MLSTFNPSLALGSRVAFADTTSPTSLTPERRLRFAGPVSSPSVVLPRSSAACRMKLPYLATRSALKTSAFPTATLPGCTSLAVSSNHDRSAASTARALFDIAPAYAKGARTIHLPCLFHTNHPHLDVPTDTASKLKASPISPATAARPLEIPPLATVACFLHALVVTRWPIGPKLPDCAEVRDAATARNSSPPSLGSALGARENDGTLGIARAAVSSLALMVLTRTAAPSAAAAASHVPTKKVVVSRRRRGLRTASSFFLEWCGQAVQTQQPHRHGGELYLYPYASATSGSKDIERSVVATALSHFIDGNGHLSTSSTSHFRQCNAAEDGKRSGSGYAHVVPSASQARPTVGAASTSGASEEKNTSTAASSSDCGAGSFSFILPKGGGVVSSNDLRNGSCVIVNGQPYRVLQFQSVKMARAAAYVRARLKNLLTGATVDHSFRSDEKLQIPEITVVNATFAGVRHAASGRSSSSEAATTAATGGRGKGGLGGGKRAPGGKNNSKAAPPYGTTHCNSITAAADAIKGRAKVLVFLNTDTWEEVLLSDRDTVERIGGFLQNGMGVKLGIWEDRILDIALPPTATYVVSEVSGSRLEQRGNPGRKQAILETGARISVPHFVREGDRIVVRTNTGDFVKRF